ncbi:hypothetical protein [Acidithiobacillus ferrooxidans]|uniref:hypothetical protein n=1 Tax=Acidithiobacillus ferrooxidans TaxID=920 RepID=UPI0013D45559|nr:hypothetical protein [Acidithiobacillus ferrooxidans]
MKAKNGFKRGILAVLTMLATPLSLASTSVIMVPNNVHHITIDTATARYIETCKDHVCTQHQVSPAYFAIPVRVPAQVTVKEVQPTRDLFFNPDGLPAPRDVGKPVSTQDCVFHGHVLKPGGEVDR